MPRVALLITMFYKLMIFIFLRPVPLDTRHLRVQSSYLKNMAGESRNEENDLLREFTAATRPCKKCTGK